MRLVAKIKAWADNKFIVKDGAKVLSDNNYTTDEKSKLASVETGATKVIVDRSLSSSSTNAIANDVVKSELDKKATLASPSFTGSPTAPTQVSSDKSTKIATTKFVSDAVQAAIAQVKQMEFKKVTALPSTGDTSKIYLLPKATAGDNDVYDEYFWDADSEEFEHIGSTSMDLSGYVLSSDLVAVSDAEIDAMFD